jgi:hypothetical protein
LCVVFCSSGAGANALPSPTPEPKAADQDAGNPFAPQPASPLPAGMTGSDANDPRARLTPGLYDAGQIALGIRHLRLLKKPDAFQLGTENPADPKVDNAITQLGMGNPTQIPSSLKLVLAGLGFANSDLAFQGNHLFQGNFYGVNIYDISDPVKTRLLTSIVCPGGQGDVSVYKNLMFMSVEMPNGRLDCSADGFPPQTTPECPQRQRIVSAAYESLISATSQIRNRWCGADLPRVAYAHTCYRSER